MEPSRVERVKMGAIMGGTVGLCLGLVFGTYTLFRYGPGPRGYVQTLGQYMATSAGSFALFMSIGSFIRSEEAHHFEQRRLFSSRGFKNIPVEVLESRKWDRS
ncbi:hypothetical protein G9A89_014905 [Geosiphon pyriformis]|nr:hypothetical protein G9A89_014905 [Geosiphon pyriformis]